VPSLAPLVTVTPSHFSSLSPAVSYAVDLTIAVPSGAAASTLIAGTVHATQGATTIAAPLPVSLDTEVASFKTVDPTKLIMTSDGSVFPTNQVIARLISTATPEDAQQIATLIAGDLVGVAPSSNSWEIDIPTDSEAALETALFNVSQSPMVMAAFPNNLGRFFVTTDLTSLKLFDPNNSDPVLRRAQAYDQVRTQEAWDEIESLSIATSPVIVGAIDNGVVTSHPEFVGVSFLANPLNAVSLFSTFPGYDHGTSVTGIIGGNNAGIADLPASEQCAGNNGLQMTGILAGVPNINYSFDVVGRAVFDGLAPFFPDYDLLTYIDNLGGRPAVNISFGFAKCSVSPATGCILDKFFDSYEQALLAHVQRFQSSTLFVVAAGNDGVDVSAVVPAALGTEPNVVTVGGTNPSNDLRASFTNPAGSSNFGSAIGLAAPAKVWAPVYPLLFLGLIPSWDFFTGTSASAPMVSGAAGILKAIEGATPSKILTPQKIKGILIASADPIQTGEPSKRLGTGCYANPSDPVNTGCRLNILRAVQQALAPPAATRIYVSVPAENRIAVVRSCFRSSNR
jgi:subtilisin family serine protease